MIRLNLLPHRQMRRARLQREFNFMLIGTFVAAIAVVILGETYLSNGLDEQTSRNARLNAAIANYEKDLVEIKSLKNKIHDVIERKKVVENLQANRSKAVILLDEITRKLPEGVYLKSLKQQGQEINIVGVADTNARVATLVRNINDSEYLAAPNLLEIKSENVNNSRQNTFTLTLNQKVSETNDSSNVDAKAMKKLLDH